MSIGFVINTKKGVIIFGFPKHYFDLPPKPHNVAFVWAPENNLCLSSPMFLLPKSDGCWRPVINLTQQASGLPPLQDGARQIDGCNNSLLACSPVSPREDLCLELIKVGVSLGRRWSRHTRRQRSNIGAQPQGWGGHFQSPKDHECYLGNTWKDISPRKGSLF